MVIDNTINSVTLFSQITEGLKKFQNPFQKWFLFGLDKTDTSEAVLIGVNSVLVPVFLERPHEILLIFFSESGAGKMVQSFQ